EGFNGGFSVSGGYRPAEIGASHVAVGREANIVVLHLIETEAYDLFGQTDVGLPHLPMQRIHPRRSVLIPPKATCPGIADGVLRMQLCYRTILEHHNSGDGVYAIAAELLEQPW